MSDEDAAKDDTNTDAAAKAEAARPQAGSDADVTAKFDSGDTEKGAAAESAASKADASKTDAGKSDADKNAAAETVKMKSADPGDEPTVKFNQSKAAATAPAGGGGRPAWVPIAAAFAAGVLLVAAITAVVVFALQASDRGGQLDARDESTKAACDFGRQVGTYDAKNFDDYVKRVKDRSTGDWATQFEAASSALKDITTQAQARSGIDEIHCAWESGDDDKATVIMLITQNQSKAAAPQPQHITIGVVATMEKKGDKWLASSFQSPMMNDMGPIPAPGEQAPSGQAPAPQPGG